MAAMRRLDHLVIAATDLDSGALWAGHRLGQPLQSGGQHARMGTHNRLLSLGPREYLEVIAIDPAAPPPARPRWFGLDDFTGVPRLVTWVASDDDLTVPPGWSALNMERGDLRWQFALPDDGRMPGGGALPALIRWRGDAHPAARLPDQGFRLLRLDLTAPEPEPDAALAIADPRITLRQGASAIRALIRTPAGTEVWL